MFHDHTARDCHRREPRRRRILPVIPRGNVPDIEGSGKLRRVVEWGFHSCAVSDA